MRLPKRGARPGAAAPARRARRALRRARRPVSLAERGLRRRRRRGREAVSELAQDDPPEHSARPPASSIGIADSGVDDDRLAPRQAPLLHLAIGGGLRAQDPLGHGTAVASMLVANRPDVGVVGLVPDATLLSARIVKSASCSAGRARGRPRGRASAGCAGRARRSSTSRPTVKPSPALVDSLRALQLYGALVVAAVGNDGDRAGRRVPGLAAGRARRRRAGARLLKQVWPRLDARPSGRSRRARGGHQGASRRAIRRSLELRRPRSRRTAPRSRRRSSPPRRRWSGRRTATGTQPRSRMRSCAAPTPLGQRRAEPDWGYGRLDVRARAAHARACPTRTSRTTGSRPRSPSGRCARERWSSRASAAAGDHVDAYTVDVPAARRPRAVLREGGRA